MNQEENQTMNNNKTDEWKEWWDQIRNLSETQRSRALTYRCKECGKGSLQGVKTTFPQGEVEAICSECK